MNASMSLFCAESERRYECYNEAMEETPAQPPSPSSPTVSLDCSEISGPIFQARLWVLREGGDFTSNCDWIERLAWVTRSGSLVYFSMSEKRSCIYFTSDDLSRARIKKLRAHNRRPWSFQVLCTPAPEDGRGLCLCYATRKFAAESEEALESWIRVLTAAGRISINSKIGSQPEISDPWSQIATVSSSRSEHAIANSSYAWSIPIQPLKEEHIDASTCVCDNLCGLCWSSAPSWKEVSKREWGNEGYHFGDVTRLLIYLLCGLSPFCGLCVHRNVALQTPGEGHLSVMD